MYNIESLKQGLDKCDQNIKLFEEEIDKANAQKKELREHIRILEEKEALSKEKAKHVTIEIEEDNGS